MSKSSKILSFIFAFAIVAASAATSSAADLRLDNPQNTSGILHVSAAEAIHNLYAFGGQVVVDSSSSKDATAAGGSVTINGNTADDLIVAGGTVDVRGNVGGSARVFGGNVTIDGKINEDLVVAGGTVYISNNASIGGDLLVAGGNVVLDAPVTGSVHVAGGNIEINNAVNGSVNARVSQHLFLNNSAVIRGDLTYSSPTTIQLANGAKIVGATKYTPLPTAHNAFRALLTVAFFIRLLAMIIAAFVLLYLFRSKFTAAVNQVRINFWTKFGLGLLALILTPIVAMVLFVTLVGYYLAVILLALYVVGLMLAALVGASALGSWLVSQVNEKEFSVRYRTVAVGIIVVAILKVIPFLGWLITFVIIVTGFGAIIAETWNSRKIVQ